MILGGYQINLTTEPGLLVYEPMGVRMTELVVTLQQVEKLDIEPLYSGS